MRLSPSAATAAALSTWANGPAEPTGSPRRSSILKSWKDLKTSPGLRKTTMNTAAANGARQEVKTRWGQTTWAWLTGTFFGIGLLRPGPGTWASLAATVLWFLAARAAHPGPVALTAATLAAG